MIAVDRRTFWPCWARVQLRSGAGRRSGTCTGVTVSTRLIIGCSLRPDEQTGRCRSRHPVGPTSASIRATELTPTAEPIAERAHAARRCAGGRLPAQRAGHRELLGGSRRRRAADCGSTSDVGQAVLRVLTCGRADGRSVTCRDVADDANALRRSRAVQCGFASPVSAGRTRTTPRSTQRPGSWSGTSPSMTGPRPTRSVSRPSRRPVTVVRDLRRDPLHPRAPRPAARRLLTAPASVSGRTRDGRRFRAVCDERPSDPRGHRPA